MSRVIVAPSILSLDYANPSEQMDILKNSHAEWIHYDVMDSSFVPNLTFGVDLLKGMEKRTGLKMDVHLMVQNPNLVVDMFINEKVHCITIHYEVLEEQALIELANKIKSHNKLAGICFKPKTDVNLVLPLLKHFDLVLVMGVEPGFGGQPFIENTPNLIKTIYDYKLANDLNLYIEVDGGINYETGKRCVEAGANVLVAGSYVFKGNINENIDKLWQL